jgi:TPR repeat protein
MGELIISDQLIVFKLGRASKKSNSYAMSIFSKSLILVFLLKIAGVTTVAWSAERWSPKITYGEIVSKAQAGSPYFQGILGIYLRSGEAGSKVDVKLAKQWSESAYRKGHPFGSYNLANLAMLDGDFEAATRLYQDAALLLQRQASDGDPVAMYCMGEIDFQVIPTNVVRALGLFRRSAESGYPQAQATIGALYLKGLPGLLEKDTKQGISMLSKAVIAKSLTARFNLGMAYYNGDGVPQDAVKASQWLKLAARQNFSEAKYSLGLLLIDGEGGISKNTNEGLSLLRQAADQNHQLAREYLRKREGVDPLAGKQGAVVSSFDSSRSFKTDEEVLDEARGYYTGVGVPRDYARAYELFLPLAKGGNPVAARFVGLMILTGKGTKRDPSVAKEWLSVSAQKGDETAKRLLDSYKSLF